MIRIASGAFRSSPILALAAESGVLPFDLLACQCLITKSSKLEEKKALSNTDGVWPITTRARARFCELTDQELPPVAPRPQQLSQSWNSKPLSIDLSFREEFKVGESEKKAKAIFRSMETKYQGYRQIFTDGSVDENGGVGLGIAEEGQERCARLPKECTIFSAEARAIMLALREIQPSMKTVIFTDSASCLDAIDRGRSNHPWIREAQQELGRSGATICWIPGHNGIDGNNKADTLAKRGRTAEFETREVPANDRITWSKFVLTGVWERKWHQERDAKLRSVKPSTAAWPDRPLRREQRILTRLRIGHTRLTHGWLMAKEATPICDSCGIRLSVKHLLIDCRKYENEREELNIESTLGEVLGFENEREERVLKFIRKIG